MTGDELVHGWKEERMNGRMVPRRIMVFVFRLCLLGIILPSLWRENLTLRIFSIFFNLWWDDLVDGCKDGRMVPRRIMVFVGTWLLWRWLLRSYLEPGYTEHNHFVVFNIFFWFFFWFFFELFTCRPLGADRYTNYIVS